MNFKNQILLTLFLFPCLLVNSQTGENLFNHSGLHEIRFYFFETDFWEHMNVNYDEYIDDSGIEVPYTKAFVKIDGVLLDTVGIRQKGLSSHFASSAKKKPLKVDLNEFITGQNFDGIKKFNLQNGSCDPGMMRDFVVYDVLRKAGVKAPRVSYCRLYLNDEYWGLYEIIEQIDKTFVDDNFAGGNGTLIKNIGWSELHWDGPAIDTYLVDFQLKTNETTDDWSDFLQLLNVINNSSDGDFPVAIQQIFNVDGFLHQLAVDLMTNNWDSYIDNGRNWYLYHEPSSGKFHWIPWDYNLSLGGDFPTGGNPYPPFDSTCFIQATFSHVQNGSIAFFLDETIPAAESWYWDFGDGTISTESHPIHEFTTQEKTTVCLTATRNENGQICESTRCKELYPGFDAFSCNTQLNGTCPYSATDPIFQEVAANDDFCCNDAWDAICELQYQEIKQGADTLNEGVAYDLDFPLFLQDSSKVLVRRLMNVPEFRERYLDICCILLEKNFNQERLFPLIDAQVSQIRDAIYEDSNYIFTPNYFEYDIGNGTGGGGSAKIPSIKWVLNKRFAEVAAYLEQTGHNCSQAFSQIGWQDVVINEFVAASDSVSGIPDPAGGYADWIELYNNTNETLDLSGFYLSDDENVPLHWKFPAGTVIEPSGYLIIWADEDETEAGLHANFKLSKSGETIKLIHEDGTPIDSVTYAEQITNVASARIPNGIGNFIQQATTFNKNNELVNSSIESESGPAFKIYPNPADKRIVVQLENPEIFGEKMEISLWNSYGQLITTSANTASAKMVLAIENMPEGIYFLEVKIPGRVSKVEKIMILHRD